MEVGPKTHVEAIRDPSAAADPQYIAVVNEITAASNATGWLTGKGGAFERQDIQFLSEHTEAERAKEQDLQALEATEFAKLRWRLETASSAGAAGDAASDALRIALKEKKEMRHASKLLPAIKVLSPTGGLDGGGELFGGRQGSAKRARTGSAEVSELDVAAAAAMDGSAGGAPPVADRAVGGGDVNGKAAGEPLEAAGSLQGLLGGYGSSDGEEEQDEDGKQKEQDKKPPGSGLPSALELFADEEDDAGGRVPLHWRKAEPAPAAAPAKKQVGSSDDSDDGDTDSSG